MSYQQKNFVLYDASAGSGKTFTLVRNFILQLLRSANENGFQQILAVTFTNKAANEMKGRILSKLQELHKGIAGDADYNFFSENAALDKEQLQAKSGKILTAILHNYSLLSVSTIDKFNLRILRSFSKDLDLAYGFEVELDTQLFYQRVMDRVYADLKDPSLINQMVGVALSNMSRDEHWDFSENLSLLVMNMHEDVHIQNLRNFQKHPFEEVIAFKEKLEKKIGSMEPLLRNIAQNQLQRMDDLGLNVGDFAGGSRNGFRSIFEKNAKGTAENMKLLSAAVLDNIENRKYKSSSAQKSKWPILEDTFDEMSAALLTMDELLRKRNYWIYILRSLGLTSLLLPVAEKAFEMRDEENIVLISDVNQIIFNAIKDQDAPYIYERLGTKYTSYFIDEFQDTSDFQWSNLGPLLQNARAEGNYIMIVGDPKQSIYRFRGGNPDLMLGLTPENYHDLHPVSLNKNWRSTVSVVNFNNQLYSHVAGILSNEQFRDLYAHKSAQELQNTESGYVSIELISKDENTQNQVETDYEENSELSQEENSIDLYLEKTTQVIEDCLSRNYSWSDIAILVRTSKQGNKIANHLSACGFPVISDDSLFLSQNAKVNFIIQYLFYCNEPHKKSLLADFIITLHDMEKLSIDDLSTFLRSLKEADTTEVSMALAKAGLQMPPYSSGSFMLYSFVERVIDAMGWSENDDAFLLLMLDQILAFQMKHGSDLTAFLEFWQLRGEKIKLVATDSQNAIRVMTIHKSKGLEFPVVILPYFDYVSKDQSGIWMETGFEELPVSYLSKVPNENLIPKNLDVALQERQETNIIDQINLLYVATTRAEKELYMFGSLEGKSKINELVNLLMQDRQTYTLGQKEIQLTRDKVVETKTKKIPMTYNAWESKVRIAHEHISAEDEVRTRARLFGDKMHAVLEKIQHRNELPVLLANLKRKGFLTKDELPRIEGMIRQVFEREELKGAFEGFEHLNEREFLGEDGRLFKPDRLVKTAENQWMLIDYKTGAPNSTHINQIQRYSKHLSQMGYTILDKFLVYLTDEIQIQKVE